MSKEVSGDCHAHKEDGRSILTKVMILWTGMLLMVFCLFTAFRAFILAHSSEFGRGTHGKGHKQHMQARKHARKGLGSDCLID